MQGLQGFRNCLNTFHVNRRNNLSIRPVLLLWSNIRQVAWRGAIKQSVDGSGYPSSALFPITGERGGGGGETLSMRRTRIRTIYIFGSVVVT